MTQRHEAAARPQLGDPQRMWLLWAMEWGFKAAEKGHNLDKAIEDFRKLLAESR